MTEASILIVDDEPNNFDVIEAFLVDRPYQLHYASGGQEAIDSLDVFQPDVILLDVMMPGLDGLDVCRRIKSLTEWQAVPIIMVTALTTKEDLANCLAAGADDFISKPVHRMELRARLQSMLRIKQQYDQIKTLSQVQVKTIDLLQSSLGELRGNLASSLPHELKTPLNGIFGVIGLLLDQHDKITQEEAHELLGLAQESAVRLEKLTQKFLTYVKLELVSPDVAESNSAVDGNDNIPAELWVESIASNYAEHANRLNDLVIDLKDEDIQLAVKAKDIQTIIEELVENAFKFSQPRTPVTISGQVIYPMLHLSISDQGRGMTAHQIASVEAFMQFERKFYEQQGMGLGLKIVKKTLERCGGELSITSIYQQQTTIHVALPLAPHKY